MISQGETVVIARRQPYWRLIPALFAFLVGGIVVTVWAVTTSRSIHRTVRAIPAQFVPATQALTAAGTDMGAQALPLRAVLDGLSAEIQAREEAKTALGRQMKSELEQP